MLRTTNPVDYIENDEDVDETDNCDEGSDEAADIDECFEKADAVDGDVDDASTDNHEQQLGDGKSNPALPSPSANTVEASLSAPSTCSNILARNASSGPFPTMPSNEQSSMH
jgi:hypothetical protein